MPSRTFPTGRRARALAAAVSVAALMAASPAAPALGGPLDLPSLTKAQVQTVVDDAARSLVAVTVTRERRAEAPLGLTQGGDFLKPFLERFGEPALPRLDRLGSSSPVTEETLAGTGFAVADDGLIATAYDLVADGGRITVTRPDGRVLPAEIAGHDDRSGLALLRVGGDAGLVPLVWAKDRPTLGQTVLTVGQADRYGTFVSTGLVAGHDGGTRLLLDDAPAAALLGAPVFDATGHVIGVRTGGGDTQTGAVPLIAADEARRVIDDLARSGAVARGYLGVQIQPVTADLADALGLDAVRGALVAEVRPDSPAQAAGLKEGDVVLAVDGTPVATPGALSDAIASRNPGQKVALDVWRLGDRRELKVSLGALPGRADTAAAPGAAAERLPDLGLALAPLDDAVRSEWGIAEDVDGVVVTAVENPALEDLQEGDVILSVQRLKVATPKDVTDGLQQARQDGRTTALILIDRQGVQTFVTVPLASS